MSQKIFRFFLIALPLSFVGILLSANDENGQKDGQIWSEDEEWEEDAQIGQICTENEHKIGNFRAKDEWHLEEKVPQNDAEMHENNAEMLGIVLGKYLCDKLAKNGDKMPKNGEKLLKNSDENSMNFEHEKAVWTPFAADDGIRSFAVRAENMFDKLNAKFGVTDEELMMSLSELRPLKGGGKSGSLFYETRDGKFLLKNLWEAHDEFRSTDAVLDKYGVYMVRMGMRSLLSRFYMMFRVDGYEKVKINIGKPDEKKVIKPRQLVFIVMHNLFYGIGTEAVLKFDIKGTFSPGSAVQRCQTQPQWRGPTDPKASVYREFDFMGPCPAVFKHGIELVDYEQYQEFVWALNKDVEFFSANHLYDYSLLLGVHFVSEEQHDDDEQPGHCVRALCRDCKSPNGQYQDVQHLCLYMGIVDILAPFNDKQHKYFLTKLKQYRGLDLQSMDQLNGQQLETVSPIPEPLYAGRFHGVVLGCAIHGPLHGIIPKHDPIAERARRGLMHALCRSYGENRAVIVQKFWENLKGPVPWYEGDGMRKQTADGTNIGIYATELFKEMMDNWRMPSWELLKSLASGSFTTINYPPEQNFETRDNKFAITKMALDNGMAMFDNQIFGKYFDKMSGPGGEQSLLPRYFAFFEYDEAKYVVTENVFPDDQKFEFVHTITEHIDEFHHANSIDLGTNSYKKLISQIGTDAKFLEENGITDYGISIGVKQNVHNAAERKMAHLKFPSLVFNLRDAIHTHSKGADRSNHSTSSAAYYNKFMCLLSTKVFRTDDASEMLANGAKYCVQRKESG